MREILFRGKKKSTGKWCEGFLVNTGDHFWISTRNDLISFAVDPETVGQYTGLADKNGKKIFEGDIVRHYNNLCVPESYDVGRIFFNTCECKFSRTSIESGGSFNFAKHCTYNYEVIGNIHDNPGLLKGGAKNEG